MDREEKAGMSEAMRRDLLGRLRAGRDEIERAVLARVATVSEPLDLADADRVAALRGAIAASFDLALDAIERRGEAAPWFPPALAAQARRAAREGIPLESVIRRCVAGEIVVRQFVLEATDHWGRAAVREAHRRWGPLFERLMEGMSEAYRSELEHAERTPGLERLRLVRRLLDGEPVGGDELGYSLDRWHLGLIVSGPGTRRIGERLEGALGCATLVAWAGEGTAWVWLGTARRADPAAIELALGPACDARAALALGEPGQGVAGWRTTHHQARGARWVALALPGRVVRYAEHALLAAALRDDVLARTLRDAYLAPLSGGRDGGASARATLRAYFQSGCNVATAAAALRVDRHTVRRRLRRLEATLGRPLDSARAELEVALALEGLGSADAWAGGSEGLPRAGATRAAPAAPLPGARAPAPRHGRQNGAARGERRPTLAQHAASGDG